MDELKTEIREEKDWNQSCLYIEVPVPYEEDYEIRMIRNNDIPGLLKVTGIGSEGKSRYAYHTGGYISLAKKFEKETVDRDMIMEFTCQFIETVNAVRDYILDPDGILLAPEYIYVKEGRYKFCYLPMSYRCLKNSFHEMTEFIVKKLDYRDTEGIFLAYILHRSTLQEEYDLRAILDEYISEEKKRREEQKQKEDISDGTIFTVEDEGEEAVEKIYRETGRSVSHGRKEEIRSDQKNDRKDQNRKMGELAGSDHRNRWTGHRRTFIIYKIL